MTILDDDQTPLATSLSGPPVGFLALAVLLELVGIAGLFAEPPRVWTIAGYVPCAIGATLLLAAFRLIDGRRRPLPGYRTVGFARPTCSLLLVLAWLVASGDAWRFATALSR